MKQGISRIAEAERGIGRTLLDFSGARRAEMIYENLDMLPPELNTTTYQNTATGNFIFLTGYSQVGGPDEAG